METGEKLKYILKKNNLTQSDFATIIDESPSSLNKALNGRDIPFSMLMGFVNHFPDIDLNWLLKDDDKNEMLASEPIEVYLKREAQAEKLLNEIEAKFKSLRLVLTQK